jgi:hypothetical protein
MEGDFSIVSSRALFVCAFGSNEWIIQVLWLRIVLGMYLQCHDAVFEAFLTPRSRHIRRSTYYQEPTIKRSKSVL